MHSACATSFASLKNSFSDARAHTRAREREAAIIAVTHSERLCSKNVNMIDKPPLKVTRSFIFRENQSAPDDLELATRPAVSRFD